MGAGRSGLFHGTRGGRHIMPDCAVEIQNTKFIHSILGDQKVIDRGMSNIDGSGLGFTQEDAPLLAYEKLNIIKVNDRVITLVAKEGYPIGTIGIVVSVFALQKVCDIEVLVDGCPKSLVQYRFDEIEVCNH